MKKIIIASDHKGYQLKKEIIMYLKYLNYEPVDLGTYSEDRVDYPIYAVAVAKKISERDYDLGILICNSGVGMSMVANKYPNVRAGLVSTPEESKHTRSHNDNNILVMGAALQDKDTAKNIVWHWLNTEPKEGAYQKRREMIREIERHNMKGTDNSPVHVSASLMCANQMNLQKDIQELIRANIDSFHIDIIDGNFAENTALTVDHVSQLRKITTLPIDVHLMVNDPAPYLDKMKGADRIFVHVENKSVKHTLNKINKRGYRAGVVIKAESPIDLIFPYTDMIDSVMFMCTDVGYKANPFVPEVLDKIRRFHHAFPDIKIYADGSIGPRTIQHLYRVGVTHYIGGTSGLFKDGTFEDNIQELKNAI